MSPLSQRERGFSLVELMFSMAIGSIILILAATMLRTSGDGYERIGGSITSEREARALMTQLSSDLSTARFHKDGVIEKSSQPWAADRLGFLSLQPAEAQTESGRVGDLCVVNYYIKDLTISGKTVRCLMRGFRESTETFDSLKTNSVGGLFTEQVNVDEPVAFGVLAFEARPRSKDSGGKWQDWVKNDVTGPEGLEVKLVLARRDLASKLKTPSDWSGSGATKDLVGQPSKAAENPNLEIYGTTIRFGNNAKP